MRAHALIRTHAQLEPSGGGRCALLAPPVKTQAYGYAGCYDDSGAGRLSGFLPGFRTFEQCQAHAVAAGKDVFGLEYPQVGHACAANMCLVCIRRALDVCGLRFANMHSG